MKIFIDVEIVTNVIVVSKYQQLKIFKSSKINGSNRHENTPVAMEKFLLDNGGNIQSRQGSVIVGIYISTFCYIKWDLLSVWNVHASHVLVVGLSVLFAVESRTFTSIYIKILKFKLKVIQI